MSKLHGIRDVCSGTEQVTGTQVLVTDSLTRSPTVNVLWGSYWFVNTRDPDFSSSRPVGTTRLGVRSTRLHVGVGSRFFVGPPGGGRLCVSPVDSSVRRHRTQTLYQGTRRTSSVWGSGQFVGTRTYGPDSLSGQSVGTTRTGIRPVYRYEYEDRSHCRVTGVGVPRSGVQLVG